MTIRTDPMRGKELAQILYRCFSTTGILGQTEMPEDIAPKDVIKGSVEHILFITQTVSIDYQRDANLLWESSRQTYEDRDTRYLFTPQMLHETPVSKIVQDMQKYKLSKKPKKDAIIWQTVGVTFYKKWQGNPTQFLSDCHWDAPTILERLSTDTHLMRGNSVYDYPYLRGPKIGPLWVRMLRDNVGFTQIQNLVKVPIPVDRHIARATLSLGLVRGQYKGSLYDIFQTIRSAWFESVEGLTINSRPMIALDVDEPLWHLSKYGCTYRDKYTGFCPLHDLCEVKNYCTQGIVAIHDNWVELDT
jgi:hypothetical protein